MTTLKTIIGFVLVGVTMEIFWTSILDAIKNKDPKLTGTSYLWMFPIYAVVPFFYVLVLEYFPDTNIFLKGFIYMSLFYILEFVSGYIVKTLVGVSPWDYNGYSIKFHGRKYKSNFMGLICLQYAPVWYIYGIIGEYYFNYLSQM
jgi:uncharacterized membrane protein